MWKLPEKCDISTTGKKIVEIVHTHMLIDVNYEKSININFFSVNFLNKSLDLHIKN